MATFKYSKSMRVGNFSVWRGHGEPGDTLRMRYITPTMRDEMIYSTLYVSGKADAVRTDDDGNVLVVDPIAEGPGTSVNRPDFITPCVVVTTAIEPWTYYCIQPIDGRRHEKREIRLLANESVTIPVGHVVLFAGPVTVNGTTHGDEVAIIEAVNKEATITAINPTVGLEVWQ